MLKRCGNSIAYSTDFVNSPVRAASPAARPPHAAPHFIEADHDAMRARLGFFRGCHPTNPFVARKWRDVGPHVFYDRIRVDCCAKIEREFVGHRI